MSPPHLLVVPADPRDVLGDVGEQAGLLVLRAGRSERDEPGQLVVTVAGARDLARQRATPVHRNLRKSGQFCGSPAHSTTRV